MTLIRYRNRKLYSRELIGYVTHGYVIDLIKGGMKVTILDAYTKQDITSKVLAIAAVRELEQRSVEELTNIIKGA